MVRQELMFRNPLKLIGDHTEEILVEGGFGAVLARAGVGKTALLVQIALDHLLRNKGTLHVSLEDPIQKVCLWYDEIFHNIAQKYGIRANDTIWDTARTHRFVMTFNVESFSVPKLEERMTDLTEQRIISPEVLLIDGLSFEENANIGETLYQLKDLARKYNLRVWFAVRTHRHEETGEDKIPQQLKEFKELFDLALQLAPTGKEVRLNVLKGSTNPKHDDLLLDPSTMLIKDIPKYV